MANHPNRSTKYRSIGQRLQRARSDATRQEIITDWARAWQREQEDIVAQMDYAIGIGDLDAIRSAAGQLNEVTRKRFDGLKAVIRSLERSAEGRS